MKHVAPTLFKPIFGGNIYSNFIILNNFKKKIIYIIEYGQVYIVKNIYNYYKNIVFNDKYLLFDTIKNNSLQFSLMSLDV